VRVWIQGMPGGDETEVVAGTITEVRDDGAVLYLREPERGERWVLAVPQEPGWGLQALWFSFIAVDAFELEDRRSLGRWFIRLGDSAGGSAAPRGRRASGLRSDSRDPR
jgi:hypothetical protein